MRHVFCIGLLVLSAHTINIKPRSVNLALKTVFKFDNRDNSADLQLIDNVQSLLNKVRRAIGYHKTGRRRFEEGSMKFSEFIEKLIATIRNYNDEDLEDISAVLSDEIRKYHYENCKFYELLDNEGIRRFVGQKLDEVKDTSAENIRKRLNEVSNILQSPKIDDKLQDFIDYVNSLYTPASAKKLKKFIEDLELYRSKSKRANLDLIKVVRDGIRSVVFDHFTSLNVNARREFKLKLETFWKEYKYPNEMRHNDLNMQYTKGLEISEIMKNKQNGYKSNLNKYVGLSQHLQKVSKMSKEIRVKEVTPFKTDKHYNLAKQIHQGGDRLTFENMDDVPDNIDDRSSSLTSIVNHKNRLKLGKFKKAIHLIEQEHLKDRESKEKYEIIIEKNIKQDAMDSETKKNHNVRQTTNKLVHKDIANVPRQRIKRKSAKTKNYSKKEKYSTTKRIFKVKYKRRKTKYDKRVTEKINALTDDDNSNPVVTAMEILSNEIGEKKVKKQSNSTAPKKSLFLTLHPEHFAVTLKRKKLKKRVINMKHKEQSTLEQKVTTIKGVKEIDPEENLEEKFNHRGSFDFDNKDNIKTTDAPLYIDTLDDEPPNLRISNIKKHKHHHKHSKHKNHKHKKHSKIAKRLKKIRKRIKDIANSEEGIAIASFDNDRKSFLHRKQNDIDQFQSNSSTFKSTKDNLTEKTKEPNSKSNEMAEYGNLDFWVGTTTMKTTTVIKTSTTVPETTILVTVSTDSYSTMSNITKPVTTKTTVIPENNVKDIANITISNRIQNNSFLIPFRNVNANKMNITIPTNVTRTTGLSNTTTQKTSKFYTKAIYKSLPAKTKFTTKLTLNAQTGKNILSTVRKSAAPAFDFGKFLNQSTLDVDDAKKKMLQETIMKDMAKIFAPTTQPPVTLAKEATDPFVEIAEALDLD